MADRIEVRDLKRRNRIQRTWIASGIVVGAAIVFEMITSLIS